MKYFIDWYIHISLHIINFVFLISQLHFIPQLLNFYFVILIVCEKSQQEECEDTDSLARYLLHGNGHSCWFDKSISAYIFKNGRVSFRNILQV